MSSRQRRAAFQSWKAPHQMTWVQAGEVEAVHEKTTEMVLRQHLVPLEGQTDILTMGLPYICPYNVNSIMNPILVMCLGLGYFFNLYRGKPLGARGRRAHHEPPHAVGVPPRAPPQLHRLLRAGAGRDHRSARDREALRGALRHRRVVPPPLPHLPTPTTASTRSTCGTGGPTPCSTWAASSSSAVTPGPCAGWASSPPPPCRTPSRWPSDTVGPQATITHLHNPPVLMADVT